MVIILILLLALCGCQKKKIVEDIIEDEALMLVDVIEDID